MRAIFPRAYVSFASSIFTRENERERKKKNERIYFRVMFVLVYGFAVEWARIYF